jgi:O-antigen/teichoic acid export membrane protein
LVENLGARDFASMAARIPPRRESAGRLCLFLIGANRHGSAIARVSAGIIPADHRIANQGDEAATPHSGARLSRNLAWSYTAWAASAFAPLLTVPFGVRYLGHRIYGEWLVIVSLASYFGLANLGIAQTVGNRIAEANARRHYRDARTLVATGFWTYAMIAIALLAGLSAAAILSGRRVAHANQEIGLACAIYLGLVSLTLPCKIYQAALRGFERVDQEQALDTAATLARTILTAAALISGLKLIAIALINGGASLASGLCAYPLACRGGGDLRPRPSRFSWPLIRALARPSLAFLALQAGAVLTLGIDNLVIGVTLGGAAVTRYAVPFRLIWMASLIFTVALNSAMPSITGHYALARRDFLARHYLTVMRLALLFAAAGAILLWTFGPFLIGLWAGAGVFPGRPVFALQLGLFMILVCIAPAIAILNATTNHYRYAVITIAEGILNLLLSLLWVRRYGLGGVIGATVAASLLTTAWYVSWAAPAVIGLGRRRLIRELAPSVAASLSALIISIAASRQAAPLAACVRNAGVAAALILVNGTIIFTPGERLTIRGVLFRIIRPPDAIAEAG